MVKLRSGRTYIDIESVFTQIQKFYVVTEQLLAHYNIKDIDILYKNVLKQQALYTKYLLINYKIYNFLTFWYEKSHSKMSDTQTHGHTIDTLITEWIVDIKKNLSFPLHIHSDSKRCVICYDTIYTAKSVCRRFIKNKIIEHNYHTECLKEYCKYKPHMAYYNSYNKKTYIECPYCRQRQYCLPL